jgi:hypothetical protein
MNPVSDPQWMLTSQKERQSDIINLLMEAYRTVYEGLLPEGKCECHQAPIKPPMTGNTKDRGTR